LRTIPKVIHIIWIGGDIPQRNRDCIVTFPRLNPDWEVNLWIDANQLLTGERRRQISDQNGAQGLGRVSAAQWQEVAQVLGKKGGDAATIRYLEEYLNQRGETLRGMRATQVNSIINFCEENGIKLREVQRDLKMGKNAAIYRRELVNRGANFGSASDILRIEILLQYGGIYADTDVSCVSPLGDIVWGVSRSLLQTNKALFEAYASRNKDATPAEYRDPGDLWIGNNLHLLVILQNTKLVPADQGPKSWADLLDPKWKGKIAFTDPANSGSAYATVTMLVDLWGGGDAGWKKVGELFRNLKVLNRSSLVFQGVGNGEYPLGISLEYAGPLWASNGAPVKVVYPSDGTTASMEGVGIVKGGPNTDSAKAFVDYINRKDVRETILKATFRRPTRGDLDLAKLPGGLPPLSAVKLVKYDEEGWTAKRTKTMEQIKDVLQDSR